MKIRNKKKKVEEVKEEVKDEEIKIEESNKSEEVETEVVEEVIIEPVDEIPEDAEVVEEVVIEPTDEVPTPESDFRFGDKVALITPRDYDGRRIDIDMFDIYTVGTIDGDKVELKKQSGTILPTKISNIRKIS
jgi:hypothetical protein